MSVVAALNIAEIHRGTNATTFILHPGKATSDQAVEAYQYIRRHHAPLLDLLCSAAQTDMTTITVEAGTLARTDTISYSQHDIVKIMPQILSFFRGGRRP